MPDFDGILRLTTLDIPGDQPGQNFSIKVTRFTTASGSASQSISQLGCTAGHLNIARGTESTTTFSNIQYIQNAPVAVLDPTGAEPAVSLYIQVANPETGENETNVHLTAGSFTELRRKNPREVNRYLRPIIREFAQERAVFGADERRSGRFWRMIFIRMIRR